MYLNRQLILISCLFFTLSRRQGINITPICWHNFNEYTWYCGEKPPIYVNYLTIVLMSFMQIIRCWHLISEIYDIQVILWITLWIVWIMLEKIHGLHVDYWHEIMTKALASKVKFARTGVSTHHLVASNYVTHKIMRFGLHKNANIIYTFRIKCGKIEIWI